jgi:RHS repeat-associated protein
MGFTGKEADEEVGLVYFGERYLIARVGRWASADPLHVHRAGGGETLNAFHYVGGNLLQAMDPVGLDGEPPSAGALAASTDAVSDPGALGTTGESGQTELSVGDTRRAPGEIGAGIGLALDEAAMDASFLSLLEEQPTAATRLDETVRALTDPASSTVDRIAALATGVTALLEIAGADPDGLTGTLYATAAVAGIATSYADNLETATSSDASLVDRAYAVTRLVIGALTLAMAAVGMVRMARSTTIRVHTLHPADVETGAVNPIVDFEWRARAPRELIGTSRCERIAVAISDHIGGDIARIESSIGRDGFLGPLRGHEGSSPVWNSHDVVVRHGRIYDEITGPSGMAASEYRAMWAETSGINWSQVDDLLNR